MKKRPISADGTEVERRKSRRFPVVVPVEVSWRNSDGIAVKEDAVARQVNGKGGFLKMANYPALGARVTVVNVLAAKTADARVLAAPDSRPGVASGIVIELIVPDENFWGVDLQVNKVIVELQSLERALDGEEIDLRLVREYRDAVEHICSVAEALRRLRAAKPESFEDREVFSALAKNRIQRATHICRDVFADLESGRIRQDSLSAEGLAEVIQQLHRRLAQFDKFVTGQARPSHRE